MQLVEQHIIDRNHPFWQEIDAECFLSKNLYNYANYIMRQHYFATNEVHRYETMYHLVKETSDYKALPAKVAQQVLITLCKNWKGYQEAKSSYKADPSPFVGEPLAPHYKHKEDGRNLLVYTIQAISKPLLRIGQIRLSGLSVLIKTKQKQIDCVRIVPRKTHYVVEVVYTVAAIQAKVDPSLYAGIDIGLDNLAVIASNKPGFVPLLVKAQRAPRPLKSINQFFNKRKAELQSILRSEKATSHQIDRLTDKRNRKINHYLHVSSRRIIDTLVDEGIGTLVIGKNDGWKQEISLGRRTNQNFVSIPHARFIDTLTYKATLVGIRVILTEESYTSKTSFLDNELIHKHDRYLGRRIVRGLFRTAKNILINADLNAAYNMIRKVAPSAFDFGVSAQSNAKGVEGVVVRPLPLGIN